MGKTNFDISNCPDFLALKAYVKKHKIKRKPVAKALKISYNKFRYLWKFETGNFPLDYIKNNIDEILAKHISEIEEYKKRRKEKREQQELKKQAVKVTITTNYNNFDYDDYYDEDDYYPSYNESKYEAELKNLELVCDYESFKKNMCNGLGQRKIKFFLNKKIKEGDMAADLYRIALEIENTNINAKKYRNTRHVSYKDILYAEKEELLKQLLKKCEEYNKINENKICYGWQHANNYSTNMLLYFELPDTEQISFHCNLSKKDIGESTPEYKKVWDEKVNSTLFKLEDAILKRYGNELLIKK